MTNNIFKNISVNYEIECFYCENAQETYTEEYQAKENDIRMKNAYRKKTGLLTSDEIVSIRAKYGICQSDLCILLGWGEKTITRYEGHQIQDRAHDSILKKISQDPEWFISLLEDSKTAFSPDIYKKYYETACTLFAKNDDKYLRKSIYALYAGIKNDRDAGGGVPLSLDKVVDMIRYFSNSSCVTNLYKVKLMKLLWYADFLSYKKQSHAITGLIYEALPMGAVPIAHERIIDLSGIKYEEVNIGEGTGYLFKAAGEKKYNYLSDAEIKIAYEVTQKLGSLSTQGIISFMHKEQAYIKTPQRSIISFEYAQELQI